jgi:MerR family mercuric resistance operon transcriptional regulator
MRETTRLKPLLIGALSSHSGVNVETIRYYERAGLLPVPPRTEGGRRSYGEDHVQRLTFIRRSRGLGFSLDEVRLLIRLHDQRVRMCCSEAKQLTVQHLTNVRAKIASLRKLERVLSQMVACCRPGQQVPCPILAALTAPSN